MRKKLLGDGRVLFAFLLLFSLLWLAVRLRESMQVPAESTTEDFPQKISPSHHSERQREDALSPKSGLNSVSERSGLQKKVPSDNRVHSGIREAVNSFLRKFLKLGGMPSIFPESGLKGSAKKENVKQNVSHWVGTKQFGFEFKTVPAATDWKITEKSREISFAAKDPSRFPTGSGQTGQTAVFLKAENQWAGAELFFAAVAKDPVRSYSEQLSDHWVAAENLARKIGEELSLKELKLFQGDAKFLPNSKFLQVKISGLDEKKNIRFKGKLFFFRLPRILWVQC